MEIGLNVDALVISLEVLVDQDEVRVDFNLSVLSDSDTYLVARDFIRVRIDRSLGNGAELQQGGESSAWVLRCDHDAKLDKSDRLHLLSITTIQVEFSS